MLYTSVQEFKKKVYYRGYDHNGRREQYIVGEKNDPIKDRAFNYYHFKESDKPRVAKLWERIKEMHDVDDFKKRLYTKFTFHDCDHKTLEGESVFQMDFGYKDTKNVKDLITSEFPDVKIYSDIAFKYKYIREKRAFNTLGHVIKIAYIDIETESENGFAKASNPTERINCISLRIQDGDMYVWALGHAEIDRSDVILKCYDDERELLSDFVYTWRKLDFDIISGWNINHFDLPYLYNRITMILGEPQANMMSPFDIVNPKMDKNTFTFAATEAAVDIIGIQILDYLEVYKKHTYENRENYKLNTIASAELGDGKLSYAEHMNLQGLYKNDFQRFVEYNIKDTDLVYRLEIALRLISLVCYLSYMSGINYEDVKSGTQTWDVIIFNHLYDNFEVIKPKEVIEKNGTYPGAYVREPLSGHYKYILSFDATSLYPSLIRQQNISAETILPITYDGFKKYKGPEATDTYEVDGLIGFKDDLSWLKDKDVCLSPSGCMFRRDKQGFAPFLMEKFFKERKVAKKEMLKLEQVSENMMKEIQTRGLKPKYIYKKPHH